MNAAITLAMLLALAATVLFVNQFHVGNEYRHQTLSHCQTLTASSTQTKKKITNRDTQNKPRILAVLARHEENMSWLPAVEESLEQNAGQNGGDLSWRICQTPGSEVFYPDEESADMATNYIPTAVNNSLITPYPLYLTSMNRGSEAIAYLQAILDVWDDMPDFMVFMHAHWYSHTHTHLMHDWQLLRVAQQPPASDIGYMSLQCTQNPPGWNVWYLKDIEQNDPNYKLKNAPHIVRAWEEYFGAAGLGPLPETIVSPSNAEFLVSRQAIQSRGKEFYQGALKWLQTTELLSLYIGIGLEYLWAAIFTNSTHVEVPQYECMCRLYGICLPSNPTTIERVGPYYNSYSEQWPTLSTAAV